MMVVAIRHLEVIEIFPATWFQQFLPGPAYMYLHKNKVGDNIQPYLLLSLFGTIPVVQSSAPTKLLPDYIDFKGGRQA